MVRRAFSIRAARGLRIAGAAACMAVIGPVLSACGEDGVGARTVTVTGAASATAPPTRPAATATAEAAAPATAPAPPATTGRDPVLVDRPADFPATGEAFLLARLDRDIARRCTREPSSGRSPGAIAGLDCATQSVYGARSSYELFRNRVGMEAAYSRLRADNGVPVARGQCVPPGGGGRVPGDATWGFGAEAPSQGRVMCFRAGGEVRFVTSVEKLNVLAFASAERFGSVDRFWRTVGIPSFRPLAG